MARSAALAAAVLGALLGPAAALRKAALETGTGISDWTYYPPNATLGIVTGGPPEAYFKMNFGAHTASIMLKYAQKHNYAFFVEKNLPKLGNRKMYWNKVILMHKLLREVPMLVWMDPEVIIKELDTPFEELLRTAKCDGTEQKDTVKYLSPKPRDDTFMYLNSDRSPFRFPLNVNTGMVVLKRTPDAFSFLSKVWDAGADPEQFKKFQDAFAFVKKDSSAPGYGWPYEQGAFWDVLLQNHDYLKKTCVAAGTHFHSVRAYLFSKGMFAHNVRGLPAQSVKQEAHLMIVNSHIKPEIH